MRVILTSKNDFYLNPHIDATKMEYKSMTLHRNLGKATRSIEFLHEDSTFYTNTSNVPFEFKRAQCILKVCFVMIIAI